MLRARVGTGTPPNESKEGENAKAILAPRANLANPLADPRVEGSHMRRQGPGFWLALRGMGLGQGLPQSPQPSLRPKPKVAKPICCWRICKRSCCAEVPRVGQGPSIGCGSGASTSSRALAARLGWRKIADAAPVAVHVRAQALPWAGKIARRLVGATFPTPHNAGTRPQLADQVFFSRAAAA